MSQRILEVSRTPHHELHHKRVILFNIPRHIRPYMQHVGNVLSHTGWMKKKEKIIYAYPSKIKKMVNNAWS